MSVPLLDIPLRASRIFAVGLWFLYGLTFILLIVAPVALALKLLLFIGLLGLSWRVWRDWRRLVSIQRLHVLPQSYRLITPDGEMVLTGGHQALVTRWLVILHLRNDEHTLRLPLLHDMAAAEDLRRLRVWLRCGK